ncbi:CheR family methyltransferase [Pokkaliibacter sp. CJK22405]|uniref:CheR family methyltransferase n=1 Tax=Pokkaliibacter sp. CJK22405 TaxID=3384615 RepID=UPI00398568A1
MTAPVISTEDFRKFREFFYRKTGILFEDSKRYFVDKRLQERIVKTGSDSFRNYFMQVRFEACGSELQTLTNIMTVNETYFFREEYQFECLVKSMLPEIIRRKAPGEVIRIWSIPSSSGEEPYSIAIYLYEYWPELAQWDVELISSDIDTSILQKAKDGLYNTRSVQNLPPALLNRHFEAQGNGNYRISQELRESVEFTRVNLSNLEETRQYRGFDVVFCRNLLIYFDALSRTKAADVFYEALNPGGFICLGHSESMSRISSVFAVRKFPHAIVYQKPEER